MERFAGYLFASREEPLGSAQVDDAVAAVDPGDLARDDRADLVAVVLHEAGPFGVADFLDDDLLGGLRGDASEDGRVEDLVVERGVDLARLAVDRDDGLIDGAEVLLGGRGQGGLDALEHHLGVDVFFAPDRIHDPDQVGTVHSRPLLLVSDCRSSGPRVAGGTKKWDRDQTPLRPPPALRAWRGPHLASN